MSCIDNFYNLQRYNVASLPAGCPALSLTRALRAG
jgi:hypothetical protein